MYGVDLERKTTWKCDDEEDEDKYERPCVEEGEREKADVTNHISSQTRRIYVLRCPLRSDKYLFSSAPDDLVYSQIKSVFLLICFFVLAQIHNYIPAWSFPTFIHLDFSSFETSLQPLTQNFKIIVSLVKYLVL